MKRCTSNRLVFVAIFVMFLLFGCGNRFQEASAADRITLTPRAKELTSPDKAGARMELKIEGVNVAFRWCPPGAFVRHWNKSTEDYWERQTTWDDDKEDFEIKLTKGFWLAETETTQELWQAVTGDNPSKGTKARKAPVNYVSWEETQEFISKLNAADYAPDGFEFRLPTEAQWEYACMADTMGERYGELDAIAWYGDNSDGRLHEVGKKKANAWGLYDMLGNVWEWCEDYYSAYPMGNLTDYVGPQDGSRRACRSGGWDEDPKYSTATSRNGWSAELVKFATLGVRLAIVPKER